MGVISDSAITSVIEVEAVAKRIGCYDCDIDIVLFEMIPMYRGSVFLAKAAAKKNKVRGK